MKANELMIGDWVMCENKYYQYYAPELNIHNDISDDLWMKKDSMGYYTGFNDIEPIPLTPKILEKNGWKKEFDKKPYMTFYHLEDEKYWLMWCISEHTLDIQRQNKTLLDQYNLCAERVVIACNYIHELQHALRLCGIDKEIVL